MANIVDVKFKSGAERKFGDNYYGATVKYEGAFLIVLEDGGKERYSFPAADILEVVERKVGHY